MGDNITDLELSEAFGAVIAGYYTDAIDFIQIKPDFSLWRFREVIEEICTKLADHHQIDVRGMSLLTKIQELHTCQVINYSEEQDLHTIRINCNSAVHKDTSGLVDVNVDFLREASARMIDDAVKTRLLVINILQSSYISLKMGSSVPLCKPVTLDDFGGQSYKEVFYDAAITDCAKDKFKAGLLFDSLADSALLDAPIVIPENLAVHIQSLRKCAVTNYEASCLVSADTDKRMMDASTHHLSPDKIVETYCDLEALYRYALASLKVESYTSLGGCPDIEKSAEDSKEPYRLLSIAADRGHVLAAAYYGEYLYVKVKNYTLAKQYLTQAADADVAVAYRWLSFYYSDGFACEIDRERALFNINKGIELGCHDAVAALGEAYHKGTYVDKDDEKAEELLKAAVDGGSVFARNYYNIDLFRKILPQIQAMSEMFLSVTNQQLTDNINPPKKISRNDPCFCGSGKKYKKCCIP